MQSFVQSSCIEYVPIRYGIICDKFGQMTIQRDLPCEQEDQTLQLASLRELLEESGISILGARTHIDGYFHFWNHVGSTTSSNKWLIKFVFGYAISGRDIWLFNDCRWDRDLKMPKGTSSIPFDPEEVSDVLSITEDELEEMVLWDTNSRKIAEDTKLLVIQQQTIAMF